MRTIQELRNEMMREWPGMTVTVQVDSTYSLHTKQCETALTLSVQDGKSGLWQAHRVGTFEAGITELRVKVGMASEEAVAVGAEEAKS